MKAWVLLMWLSTNAQFAVPGIASEVECLRLAGAIDARSTMRFGAAPQCIAYEAVATAPVVTASKAPEPRNYRYRRRRR